MQFTSREDIDAPIEAVFAEVTDVAAFERLVLGRGADLRRTDTLTEPGVGMAWHARVTWRETPREVDITLVDYDPPTGVAFDLNSGAITGRLQVDLDALTPERTRLHVDLTVAASTLSGRLMLQPVKLMRSDLDRRFRLRMAEYARNMEDRFKDRA
jgi:uncharacterized protein YndB with AHSA1/START domain